MTEIHVANAPELHLLDRSRAHRTADVRSTPKRLNIRLRFIPPVLMALSVLDLTRATTLLAFSAGAAQVSARFC
jgi:hypothetical protein